MTKSRKLGRQNAPLLNCCRGYEAMWRTEQTSERNASVPSGIKTQVSLINILNPLFEPYKNAKTRRGYVPNNFLVRAGFQTTRHSRRLLILAENNFISPHNNGKLHLCLDRVRLAVSCCFQAQC